ncbi:MAG: phosphoribosyl-AMP cyclohydrolase [Verrucomicrobiota bacterium]
MSADPEVENGLKLMPKFDANGLMPCVTIDFETERVLMVAYMNEEALRLTISTKKATYYTRSRKKIWVKGESSGHVQEVQEILVDCDQDCIVLKVKQTGAACHTGYPSCFYRRVKPGTQDELEMLGDTKQFDPEKVYKV